MHQSSVFFLSIYISILSVSLFHHILFLWIKVLSIFALLKHSFYLQLSRPLSQTLSSFLTVTSFPNLYLSLFLSNSLLILSLPTSFTSLSHSFVSCADGLTANRASNLHGSETCAMDMRDLSFQTSYNFSLLSNDCNDDDDGDLPP